MSVADKKGVGIDLSKCRSRHHQDGCSYFSHQATGSSVIVKTCSDIFYTIGQKKSPMPSAKIRNYSHSHNLMSQ